MSYRMMNDVIEKTADYMRSILSDDSSGHDWWHVKRVWGLARRIGREEHADLFVVEMAALLHDAADWKFHGGDLGVGSRAAREWMQSLNVPEGVSCHVCRIIELMPYKGALVGSEMPTLEGMVVQDADRLDAIGAVGIARTFAYGGFRGQPMWDPDEAPSFHTSFEEYRSARTNTINHFYEKLLLLRDRMNTRTARKLAEARHAYMEEFLKTFREECVTALDNSEDG